MAGITVSGTRSKDMEGKYYYIDFYGEGGSTQVTTAPNREVDRIVQCIGKQISYVNAYAPLKRQAKANSWDFLPGNAARSDGFGGMIKFLQRFSAGLQDGGSPSAGKQPLVNGWIVSFQNMLRRDCVLPVGWDDRFLLTKLTVMGRQVYDVSTKQVDWDMENRIGCTFNAMGPDMIVIRGEPYFATGYRVGNVSVQEENPADSPAYGNEASSTTVGFWTPKWILKYLRRIFYANLVKMAQDYGMFEIPKEYLLWPEGMGSNIKEDRKVQAFRLDGMNLLDALDATIKLAGSNYALYVAPLNHLRSELQVVNCAPMNKAGLVVYDRSYISDDVGELANNPSVAWDGIINEDVYDTFHGGSAVVGDCPVAEMMLSTYPEQEDWEMPGGLDFAYTNRDISNWTREVHRRASRVDPANYDQQGIEFANNKYPGVWCFYKIDSRKNHFAGTIFENWKRAGLLSFMPHQCSAYNEEESNPLGLQHREIIVEYRIDDETWDDYVENENTAELEKGRWRFLDRFTGLQLSPCGKFIMLPGTRASTTSSAGTYYCVDTNPGGDPFVTSITGSATSIWKRRHIRIQAAVMHKEALVSRGGKNNEDKTGTLHRINPKAPKFVFQVRAQPKQYIHWTRTNQSAPFGMAGTTSLEGQQLRNQAPRKGLFDDLARMDDHALVHSNNYKKVFYSGRFDIHCPSSAYSPGQQIQFINAAPISNITGVIDCVVYQGQKVMVSFGPGAPAPLYDAPVDRSTVVAGGSYPPGTTKDSDEQYDTYTGKQTGGGGSGSDNDYDTNNQAIKNNPTASGVRSDNDTDTNNQAIKHNPTADQNMGTTGKLQPTAKDQPATPKSKSEQSATRAENAKKMAADARAAGNDKAAEKHEKAARRLETRAENQKQKEEGKKDQRSNRGSLTMADGTVIGAGQLGDAMFGKSLVGGGFTMPGGKKQVRAGDLGKDMGAPTTYVNNKKVDLMGQNGPGKMFDTSKADAHDKKVYAKNKAEENARTKASWDKFAGPHHDLKGKNNIAAPWGPRGAKPAPKPAPAPAAPAQRGPAAPAWLNAKAAPKAKPAPKIQQVDDE